MGAVPLATLVQVPTVPVMLHALHVPSVVVGYRPVERSDPAAPRRYLADRAPRPVRRLLRRSVRS